MSPAEHLVLRFVGFGSGAALIPCIVISFFPTPHWWILVGCGAAMGAWLAQPEHAKWSPPITALLAVGGGLMGLLVFGVKSIIY